ncbi:tetratricopeptide repeat protein [Halomonas sp. M20]|uniref:tetratricopeptide repeat protein n=1 Tax=Halomonas sp. M20 TaxID=2763264 RepID=UPI001D0B0AB9|nr:tetratricopeptide repeat protein [Halomonas sp. M20]
MKATTFTLTSAALLATAISTASLAHEDARKTELFKPGVGFAGERTEPTADFAARVPLYEGLGKRSYKITTRSSQAQAYFDQGLKLAWGFNHAEARRAFREAQRLDPSCAMCFWGEAFVLGSNINDAMHPEAITPAFEAITQAMTLKNAATPREQALIEALAVRYAPDPDTDRVTLDQSWADAIQAVAQRYPSDSDIQVLYADALMNLQPWDYWEADGTTPKGHAAAIVATLERALVVAPGHPAAAHLYIHAVEASATPERAEPHADTLRGAMPGAGHLTHMPAHIYSRVGRYQDSLAVNRDAIAADERMLEAMGGAASPLYRFGYYPHNVHFLMVAAQLSGAKDDVLISAEKLGAITSNEVSAEFGWVQAIKTAPYSAHAQFAEPEAILALADPGNRFPFVKGYWHYARGVAFARLGRIDDALTEVSALNALYTNADLEGLEAQYVPARTLLEIAKHVVEARVEQSRQNYSAAEHHLQEAITLEDAIAYMEPPYWYYPIRQTLAAVQLQDGRVQEAIMTFHQALAKQPKNGWALWGLMQAQQQAGDASVKQTEREFGRVWLGDRSLLALDRL